MLKLKSIKRLLSHISPIAFGLLTCTILNFFVLDSNFQKSRAFFVTFIFAKLSNYLLHFVGCKLMAQMKNIDQHHSFIDVQFNRRPLNQVSRLYFVKETSI